MPKVSKETAAEVQEIGIGTISTEVVDGYEFDFFDLHEEADMSHLLKGLPDDRCTCPHWGYVTRGSVTFTFADHVETFEATAFGGLNGNEVKVLLHLIRRVSNSNQ